jgi:ABC-type multidrug transport system fused ATPase/permease subunit
MELWQILLGIAFLFAVLVPVPMVGTEAGIEGLKGINLFMLIGYEGMNAFTMLSRITLVLSFLVAITGFAYFILKRRKKEARRGKDEEIMATIKEAKEWRGREEEILEIIKEVKELKKRIEEKGMELTTVSDVFLMQILILSEIRNVNVRIRNVNKGIEDVRTWLLFGLSVVIALCLAMISML